MRTHTPTWGEVGLLFWRLALSGEIAAVEQMRSERRKRFTMKIENAIFDFHGARGFYTVGFSVSRAVQCPPVSCWTFNKS